MSKDRVPRSPKLAAKRRGAVDRLLDPAMFGALADPTRVLLFTCIAKCGRMCSVGEVAECCEVDVSVVSRHLSLMARAGVLESQREGRIVRYGVRFTEVAARLRDLAFAIEQCGVAGEKQAGCCAKEGCDCEERC